ncbi:sugar transporter [Chitinophaga sp. G-6-1-13]|uniref:Sugar transporter n=1 Tax=Chitinophaga fulva TaxID=2728842 RepID=A0A848GMV0_9BACT|nr:protein-disulfide reductase DsbD domain-containing protein [Chitinophaga fulva]NML38709.1 sugar transporter [Chitinophaga fulva]
MKKISFTLILLLTSLLTRFSYAATPVLAGQPIKWSYTARKTAAGEAVLLITATLADGWHLYALNNPANSPVRLAFNFLPDPSYRPEGNVDQPEPVTRFEKLFGADISYFEHEVVFQQKVKLTGKTAAVKGTIEFTVCSSRQCLPPETISFNINIK